MSENPYASPKARIATRDLHTWFFLIEFYGLAVIWGLRSIYFWKASAIDALVPIALAICLGWWAVADARVRGHPIPLTARWWFFVLAFAVVPCYVIWSRGWRGLGLTVVHTFGWYVLTLLVMNFGGLIVFGGEWLRGASR